MSCSVDHVLTQVNSTFVHDHFSSVLWNKVVTDNPGWHGWYISKLELKIKYNLIQLKNDDQYKVASGFRLYEQFVMEFVHYYALLQFASGHVICEHLNTMFLSIITYQARKSRICIAYQNGAKRLKETMPQCIFVSKAILWPPVETDKKVCREILIKKQVCPLQPCRELVISVIIMSLKKYDSAST